jgi:alpha-ketoglutarate-dependent taurine dioxygenase
MHFPFEIKWNDSEIRELSIFVSQNKDYLKNRIHEHGAVLLRGWNVDVTQFSKSSRVLGDLIPDISCSAGPRTELAQGVHTANEAPPCELIPFHHEMAQCSSPPKYVLFHCDIAPVSGGATPIIHSWRLAEKLKSSYPQVADKLRQRKIRYVRELPPDTDMTSPLGKSWKDTFGVQSQEDVERVLCAQGFDWEWLRRNWLRIIGPVVPIFVRQNGRDTLFTAAESVFLSKVCPNRPLKSFIYGDGSPLDSQTKEAFLLLGKFAFEHSVHAPWEKGDVLILDNATVMHARDSFVPPRRILVAMIDKL